MAAETQYTANTGIGQAVTANSALDGTGTLATVLTAASNGTYVPKIYIKALGVTTEGMVRLFLYDGSSTTRLLQEFHVPANTPTGTNPAWETVWNCDLKLEANWVIKAATQTGDDFNIIAEGLNWSYFTAMVRPESTKYTANTGTVLISTANSNRDGTGTLGTVLTAGASASYNGCRIDTVTIKAAETVTMGTVRLFLFDGSSTTRLLTEIAIPAVTQSATEMTFERKIPLNLNLQAGWSIKAGTENAEDFAITAEGNDWNYPASNQITNYTPTSAGAVTTEELLHSLQVPANLMASGGLMSVYTAAACTANTNSKTYRMYINTSNSLSGATLLATATLSTATAAGGGFNRLFPIISDTSLECYGGASTSTASSYGQTAGTSETLTVPSVSAGFWILISVQKANSADTASVRWSMVKKEF